MHRRLLPWVAFTLALLTTSACDAAPTAANTSPVPTQATPTATSVHMLTYSGPDFTIQYPSDWLPAVQSPPAGEQGTTVEFKPVDGGPATLIIEESYGYSVDLNLCQGNGNPTTLAGLPAYYGEQGVSRNWVYVDSHRRVFRLSAADVNVDQAAQKQRQDDQALETFKPSDATSGCSA